MLCLGAGPLNGLVDLALNVKVLSGQGRVCRERSVGSLCDRRHTIPLGEMDTAVLPGRNLAADFERGATRQPQRRAQRMDSRGEEKGERECRLSHSDMAVKSNRRSAHLGALCL